MAFDREKAAAGVTLFGPLGTVLGETVEPDKPVPNPLLVAHDGQQIQKIINANIGNSTVNFTRSSASTEDVCHVSDDGDMDYFSFAMNASSNAHYKESLSYLELELKYRPTNGAAWLLKGCILSIMSKGSPSEQNAFYIEDSWRNALTYSLPRDSEAFRLTIKAITEYLDGIFSACENYTIDALKTGRLTNDSFISVYSVMLNALKFYSRMSSAMDATYREVTNSSSSPFESGIGKKCKFNVDWILMYEDLGAKAYHDAIQARPYSEFPDAYRIVGNFIFKQEVYIEDFFAPKDAIQAYKCLARAGDKFVKGIKYAGFDSGPYIVSVSSLESKAKRIQSMLDMQAAEERQKKIDAYWATHEQERQEILSLIREKEKEINTVQSNRKNFPEKKRLDELDQKREELVELINKLGLFEWKEKKRLRSEVGELIEEINALSPQCESMISEMDITIREKIGEISSLRKRLSAPKID